MYQPTCHLPGPPSKSVAVGPAATTAALPYYLGIVFIGRSWKGRLTALAATGQLPRSYRGQRCQ
eukprot:scaffold4868_cov416-Prasinococcus_capsulatus_cf.AAC.19